ncbi:MAG: AI-2E family transporter, partial [Clostridia bacterium]|nr:AI-2E family transporter [Clostridia bacterium]
KTKTKTKTEEKTLSGLENKGQYADIHEKASGIPESLAEDLCEAISDAHEREEKRSKEKKDSRDRITFKNVIIAVAFGITLYWMLNHLSLVPSFFKYVSNVFSPIIIGGCIAFVLNLVLIPIERLWLLCFKNIKGKKLFGVFDRLKRPVCLILSTLILTGLIFGLFFIIVPELTLTVRTFIDMVPKLAAKIESRLSELYDFLARYNISIPELKFDTDKAIKFLNSLLAERGQQMLNTTVDFTTSLLATIFNSVLSIVFAFYVLAQKEKLGRKVKSILYAVSEEEKVDTVIKVATLSNSAFTRFVTGQFIEAVIIGTLCWLGMTILRLPYAGVISVVIGVTALIPIFGAFIGAFIGAILILAVDFMQAIWFILFIIVLQQLETNLIYPRVVGKSIGLPGILVLAAVTVGGAVFGFAGVLLGVPICSVFYCIFNEFVHLRIEDKGRRIIRKTKE